MSADDDKAAAVRTDITRAIREATGLHERFASDIADGILQRLQQRWSGDRIYIPSKDRAARDAAIRSAFDGRNHDEVCRCYGISRRTLYRVIGQSGDSSNP